MLTLALSLVLSPAHAQACDARALDRAVVDAVPARVADAFAALAACDPARARKAAAKAVPRMMAGDATATALLDAATLGAGDAVRTWLTGAEPDVRSRTIDALGGLCDARPDDVTALFTASEAALGEAFWADRWYRGLGGCRTDGVRALLSGALDHPTVGRDVFPRTPFYGLLEVYARNLGVDALPELNALLAAPRDEREAVSLVSAYGDAAGIGSATGPSPEAADAVVAALQAAAPSMPRDAVERARGVFNALDRAQDASALGRFAWPEAWDGAYRYGVALAVTVTCKNAKTQGYLYLGALIDDAGRWPDEVLPGAEDAARAAWSVEDGSSCKGTATTTFATTPFPADADALAAFADAQRNEFEAAHATAKKTVVVEALTLTR